MLPTSLQQIREQFSREASSILVQLEERPGEDELRRAENFQLAITTVILSTYISLVTSDSQIIIGNSDLLFAVSLAAFVFLTGKLGVSTLRPYYDNLWMRRFDFVFLPFFFAVSFLAAISVFLLSLVSLPDTVFLVEIAERITDFFKGPIFMGLYILILLVTSVWYAWRTGKKMSVIKSGVPEIQATFTSGESGSSLPLRVENPTSNLISPGDLKVEIHTSEGVSLTVDGARKVDDHIWEPFVPLNPDGGAMNLDLQFTRSESANEISDEHVTVEVRLKNDVQQRHAIRLTG
ncbi:hypothetical protein U4E84_03180 [Halorubrum sp. AD140]|uniref:hypothetical protein n=1 Tax=Halorubrum sp. AD140 TaxID=3050073 RepID=UPI002ACCDD15|nr:hypothetical protein [Halorubrum sp. AD140]MDZ5810356.1 hypothetical protein [Halorubrum sp. AD140]